jgi:hypothetical protein
MACLHFTANKEKMKGLSMEQTPVTKFDELFIKKMEVHVYCI